MPKSARRKTTLEGPLQKDLTAREAGAMGGRARWKKIGKRRRSQIMKGVRRGVKSARKPAEKNP